MATDLDVSIHIRNIFTFNNVEAKIYSYSNNDSPSQFVNLAIKIGSRNQDCKRIVYI